MFHNLNIGKNAPEIAGLGSIVYYASVDDFSQLPAAPKSDEWVTLSENTPEKIVTATGSLVLKSGRTLKSIQVVDDSASLNGALQGEKGCINIKNTLKFKVSFLEDKHLAFNSLSAHERYVFFVPYNGKTIMFGTKNRPAVRDVEGQIGTGENAAGFAGADYSFTAAALTYPPYLEEKLVEQLPNLCLNTDYNFKVSTTATNKEITLTFSEKLKNEASVRDAIKVVDVNGDNINYTHTIENNVVKLVPVDTLATGDYKVNFDKSLLTNEAGKSFVEDYLAFNIA